MRFFLQSLLPVLALEVTAPQSLATVWPVSTHSVAPHLQEEFSSIPFENRRFVVFGESDHRIQENHVFAEQLFSYLVEEKGFRYIALESSWRLEDYFHRYQQEGNMVFEDPNFAHAANAFHGPSLKRIFRFARDFNVRHPSNPIVITGIQPESPVQDILELEMHLTQRAALVRHVCFIPKNLSTEWEFLTHVKSRRETLGSYFSLAGQETACQNAIEKLSEAAKRKGSLSRRLSNAVLGLRNVFETMVELDREPDKEQLSRTYTRIDRHRMTVFKRFIEERESDEPGLLWMHLWHAMKQSSEITIHGSPGTPDYGAISFSSLLQKEFPEKSLVLGASAYDPAFKHLESDRLFLEPKLREMMGSKAEVVSTRYLAQQLPSAAYLHGDVPGSWVGPIHVERQWDYMVYFPSRSPLLPAEGRTFRVSLEDVRKTIQVLGSMPPHASKVSPYQQDFFGVQPLQPLSEAYFVTELKKHGFHENTVHGNETYRLSAPDGSYEISIWPDGVLQLDVGPDSHHFSGSFAVLHPNSNRNIYEVWEDLMRHLERRSLKAGTLLPNAYLTQEWKVARWIANPQDRNPTICQGTFADFSRSKDGVFLHGDVHGHWSYLHDLQAKLDRTVDWLALEMIPTSYQPALDTLYAAPQDSPQWAHAHGKLLELFDVRWNRYEFQESPQEHPIYQLVMTALKQGIKVHALDTDMPYILFNYGEEKLGLVTRNLVWAEATPKVGKGIVFGGLSHFTRFEGLRYQDFLRTPKRQTFCEEHISE